MSHSCGIRVVAECLKRIFTGESPGPPTDHHACFLSVCSQLAQPRMGCLVVMLQIGLLQIQREVVCDLNLSFALLLGCLHPLGLRIALRTLRMRRNGIKNRNIWTMYTKKTTHNSFLKDINI